MSASFLRFGPAMLAVGLSALAAAGPVRAQTVEPPSALISDGVDACAAAKTAMAARPPRAAVSLASPNLDATYYHLNLTLEMADDSLSGLVRVEGTVTGSPISELVLDLASSMIVTAVKLADGTPLTFTHPGAALRVSLPAPAAVGTTVAVDVAYHGAPVSNDLGNFVFGQRPALPQPGDRYAWSLSEPYGAREWWPCKDHPSDKADSVRVTVTVPSQYRVGSQGVLAGETPSGGTTTYDWVSRYPISSYLVSVAIGEYVRYQDTYQRPPGLASLYGALSLPLDYLVYDDGTSALFAGWAGVVNTLPILEDWFGPYPFADEKYGHAEFTFGGGMEHQTMTSLGTSAPGVVAHELAHQWYGDSISPKTWPHLWLNEGFATYAELIYWDKTDSLTHDAVLGSFYRAARWAPGTLVLEDTTSVNNMFDGTRVYAKGGMVLWMLEYMVGESGIKDILRTYAADPAVRYGVATTADFQRVAEAVSGRDLDAFFRQWVTDGTGYPSYASASTWQQHSTGYHVWVTIAQTQTAAQSNVDVFDMPVDIMIRTAADTVRAQVRNDRRSQVFEIEVANKPVAVTIDPDRRILRGDEITSALQQMPSYPTITALAPNPSVNSFDLWYSIGQDDDVDINVFDVRGRRVMTQTISSTQAGVRIEPIDVSRLSSGVYFLRLHTGRGEATRKFVVVR
jgi:aminopeptidase N